MTQQLFRKEVLETRRYGWLGSISLTQPLRIWWLTIGAVLAALLVGLFLTLGTYTKRSTLTGQLVPTEGLATVLAPATGVVSRINVREGGQVSEGQTVAVVTVPRATVGGGETSVALERRLERRRAGLQSTHQSELQILNEKGDGLRVQLSSAEMEIAQIEVEIGIREEQIRIAEETLRRLRQLEDERYVSLLQIEQQESNALSWRAEMQTLLRQATTTRRLVAQLRQALRELPSQIQAAEGTYQNELAKLDQEQVEIQARGAIAVTAPVDGIASAQLTKPGQSVEAGQPLLTLLPSNDTLEAELLVPSRAIGFIKPGDRVLLHYQAYPYQKFGHHEGLVSRISRSALDSGELSVLADSFDGTEPLYRVTVALTNQSVTAYGNEEPLRPGMLVSADVLAERRRLFEWIFEPLYSLKAKIT